MYDLNVSCDFSHPTSGSFVKSTEVNHGSTFVNALKEQYYVDLKQAREDYEESMKDFAVSVFNFANLEKVKGLHGWVTPNARITYVPYDNLNVFTGTAIFSQTFSDFADRKFILLQCQFSRRIRRDSANVSKYCWFRFIE